MISIDRTHFLRINKKLMAYCLQFMASVFVGASGLLWNLYFLRTLKTVKIIKDISVTIKLKKWTAEVITFSLIIDT